MTRLSVFGIGYVGCVSAACFAKEGHAVTGVDVNAHKVEMINAGKSPIVEAGIGELLNEVVVARKLSATTNSTEAVLNSDVSLICVGTPSNQNGSLDLRYVTRVCEEIGTALKDKGERHVVVIRSTMLPGTIESVVIPTLEQFSGKHAAKILGLSILNSCAKDFVERLLRPLLPSLEPTMKRQPPLWASYTATSMRRSL